MWWLRRENVQDYTVINHLILLFKPYIYLKKEDRIWQFTPNIENLERHTAFEVRKQITKEMEQSDAFLITFKTQIWKLPDNYYQKEMEQSDAFLIAFKTQICACVCVCVCACVRACVCVCVCVCGGGGVFCEGLPFLRLYSAYMGLNTPVSI